MKLIMTDEIYHILIFLKAMLDKKQDLILLLGENHNFYEISKFIHLECQISNCRLKEKKINGPLVRVHDHVSPVRFEFMKQHILSRSILDMGGLTI